jgi:hypothetical protein
MLIGLGSDSKVLAQTQTPSAPLMTARLAFSADIIPFTITGILVKVLIYFI